MQCRIIWLYYQEVTKPILCFINERDHAMNLEKALTHGFCLLITPVEELNAKAFQFTHESARLLYLKNDDDKSPLTSLHRTAPEYPI